MRHDFILVFCMDIGGKFKDDYIVWGWMDFYDYD